MNTNNKKSVFHKLLISYLLISIVPLVILGSLFYYYNVINYKKSVREANLSHLVQVKNQVDLDLKVLKDITYHISNNTNMLNIKEEHSNDVIQLQLKAYLENSTLLNEILYYSRGSKRILSNHGDYEYYDFEWNLRNNQKWSNASFFSDLNSIIAPRIKRIEKINMNKENGNNLIALMYPVPYLSTIPKATIVYVIEEKEILAKFNTFFGNFSGDLFIFDNQNQLLASSNSDFIRSDENLYQLIKQRGTGIYETNISTKSVVLIRTISEDTGWNFVIVMSPKQFYKEVHLMRKIVLAILSILLIIGLVLAYILSSRSYKPISTLISYIKNRDSQSEAYDGKNEIEMIRFSFEKNYKKYRELVVQLDAQRPIVRDQCLTKILKGKVKDINDLSYLLRCSNIQLQGSGYFTMALSTKIHNINIEDLLKILEYICFVDSKGYGVELAQEKLIAILVCIENNKTDYAETQLALANDVFMLIQNHFHITPKIGVGRFYEDILMLNSSFLEAVSMLHNNLNNNSSNIYLFNDVTKSDEQIYWYSIREQSLFIESLKLGDKAVALETLKSIINTIQDKTTSYIIMRCICFDILNNVIKSIDKVYLATFNKTISELAEFSTLDEFKERMEIFSLDFCTYIEEFKEQRTNELKNNIIKYVNDNYNSDHISLDDISSQFDVSSSFVSKFFKNETGVNFIEYVTNLRMDYIKKELRNTENSIKDIAINAGYIDAASFTRKFRCIEGVTPSQYRKITKQIK